MIFRPADLAFAAYAAGANQPWQAALANLAAAADARLGQQSHAAPTYVFPPTYLPSGADNPAAWPALETFIGDADAAFVCALAYRVTGALKYAVTAAALCRSWAAINTSIPGATGELATCSEGNGFLMAADLLSTYSGWTATDRTAFAAWVRAVLVPNAAASYGAGHNLRSWALDTQAKVAAYFDDSVSLSLVEASLASHIEAQIDPTTGRLPEEETRGARAVWYTYFSLVAITSACRVIRDAGGDDLFASQRTLLTLALNRHLADLTPTFRAGQDTYASPSFDLFEAMGDEYQYNGGPYKDYARPHRPILLLGHHLSIFTAPTLLDVEVPAALQPKRRKAHRRATDGRPLDVVAAIAAAAA